MKKLKTILHSKYFYIFLIIITLINSTIYLLSPKSSKININDAFIGVITNYEINGDLLTLELKGIEKMIGYYYFNTKEEKEAFKNIYQLGDKVLVNGTFTKPKNNTVPNLFNYKKYLETKNIYYLMEIDNIQKKENNNNFFYLIKNKLIKHINNYQSSSYLHAFILGNNDLIAGDVTNSYQENGISHLLAISGMHVSLLSSIILFLLIKFKIKDNKSYLITIIFLLFYMILSGSSASVLRSVLLFSLLSVNKIFKLEVKTIGVFIIVFCLLVLGKPYFLFDVGFQFSFAISFYLILLQNKLNTDSYIKSLFKISVISFLVSLPISIYYFYQINILSIIFNMFFVPFVSFIIFPFSLITLLLPFLDSFLMILIEIMENVSGFCNSINFSKLIIAKPNLIWIFIYYIFLTIFLIKGNKISLGVLIILVLFQYFNTLLCPKSYFIMIDVGQGDCMLIHSNNKTMLVDTGGKITYEKEEWQKREIKTLTDTTLIPLLKSLGIRKLDYLVLTHGDNDHLGEAINLINKYKIKNIIFNDGIYNEKELKIIEKSKEKGIAYYQDKINNKYQVGEFKLISINDKNADENESSITFYMIINGYKFLLTGDIGVETEEKVLNSYDLFDITFLKVGHHGSKNSTSESLLKRVKPKYALISVAVNNVYNHPSEEVINKLNEANIRTFLTSIHGSIVINFKKDVTFSINPP